MKQYQHIPRGIMELAEDLLNLSISGFSWQGSDSDTNHQLAMAAQRRAQNETMRLKRP